MQFLSIEVNKNGEAVAKHLENELKRLRNRKMDYTVDIRESEAGTNIICALKDGKFCREKPEEAYRILAAYIANALADYIVVQYEEKLLNRIINNNYCYFTHIEKKEILNKAIFLTREDSGNFFNSLFQIRRRNIIICSLMEYFEN